MSELLPFLLLIVVAFVAATLAAVTGFGGAAILLPILAATFGVRDAIPILTLAQLIGNASRVWFNRREVAWPVIGWFALGGVPAALIGGWFFATAPLVVLTRFLGVFLLMIVAYRRLRRGKARAFPLRGFAPLGAVSSFLSALVGSVGPLMAPFFLAYGLVKGAYIGTEAMAAVTMHLTKLTAYQSARILTPHGLTIGLGLGPVMVLGSYTGKRLMDRVSERVFVILIEITLVAAGGYFLIT